MEINEFAKKSHARSQHNNDRGAFDWEYYLIATGGEAGELLNKLKKFKRGDYHSLPSNQVREMFIDEMVDVITYAFLFLSEMNADPEKAILKKYEEVDKRLAAGGFDKRPEEK